MKHWAHLRLTWVTPPLLFVYSKSLNCALTIKATTIIKEEEIALMTADPGASGRTNVFTSTLLQPCPSQVKQFAGSAQTDSLETHPRSKVSPRRKMKQRSLAVKVGHREGAAVCVLAHRVVFPVAEQMWQRARFNGKIWLLHPGRPIRLIQVSQWSAATQVACRSADHSVAHPRTVSPSRNVDWVFR